MAGINVPRNVQQPLDSVAMLPYLTHPKHKSIREWNYTQIGLNLQANGAINGPCQFSNSCSHIPVSKSVCEDNGGVWWGAGTTDPSTAGIPSDGLTHCCDVQKWLHDQDPPQATVNILPQAAVGIRNLNYKLARNTIKDYDVNTDACVDTQTDEFYEINENVPVPKLDREDDNLLDGTLTASQNYNYQSLMKKLEQLQKSVVQCEGDGNLDLVVDNKDISGWHYFSENGGKSSWHDVNLDGLTNTDDLTIIQQNYGTHCKADKQVTKR